MKNFCHLFAKALAALALVANVTRAEQTISAAGDASMEPLLRSWIAAAPDGLRRGDRWLFVKGGSPFGDLMFETIDVAALARLPTPAELAPYAHQFAGDMMKSPLLIRVAADPDAYLLVNKRPDSPLPPNARALAAFALSARGQELVAASGSFHALGEAERVAERAKLDGYLAALDPSLQPYKATSRISGEIRSVGSDGMKTLMERWMRDFRRAQPGVRKGDRWEHLGTLNGFHALVAGQADIAPMGRELWPAEAAIHAAARTEPLLEIRVARGGFNTPQRTTAQAIFVNAGNPLARITIAQLVAIFAQPPSITRWGELGLGGEWTQRPIAVYMPPREAPNSMSMQLGPLEGRPWSSAARAGSIAQTAAAIAADPSAIGFGGLEEGGPGLKALAVSAAEGAPHYALDAQTASTGRYPLTRYMYIRLELAAARRPEVREFLRYILSREGQEPVLYSGYFPLREDEAAVERAKLDQPR